MFFILLLFITVDTANVTQFINIDSANNLTKSIINRNVTIDCSNDHRYDSLDVREIFGKWYVFEVYTHLKLEGVTLYKSCPLITIWETDDFPRTTFGVSPYISSLGLYTISKHQ